VGDGTRRSLLRLFAAGAALLAAAFLLAAVWIGAFDFSRLYGLEATLSVSLLIAGIGGLLVAGLLLLARRVAGLRRPTRATLVVGALLLALASATAGAMAGDRQRAEGAHASASACAGEVGRDLEELARASGQLAAGDDPRPNSGVVLDNGSATHGTSSGECVALVNARVEDVQAAAVSLGWAVESADLAISHAGVPVSISLDSDQAPGTHPVVRLSGSR
jgi:hypothetical protein